MKTTIERFKEEATLAKLESEQIAERLMAGVEIDENLFSHSHVISLTLYGAWVYGNSLRQESIVALEYRLGAIKAREVLFGSEEDILDWLRSDDRDTAAVNLLVATEEAFS